jgi:hypothetical protein
VIEETFRKYFDTLRSSAGIVLTPRQQAWYCKKAQTQLSDMKREYPSTPEEAFEASIQGAYFADQMAAAELQGRIGEHRLLPDVPVNTALGHRRRRLHFDLVLATDARQDRPRRLLSELRRGNAALC